MFTWLVCLVVLLEIAVLVRVPVTLLWRRSRIHRRPLVLPPQPPHIVVLLPALREQPIVESTVQWFAKMSYPEHLLHVVIVTTEKEELEYRNRGEPGVVTTAALAEAAVARVNGATQNPRFLHLHDPRTDGNKATQLTYAARSLHEMMPSLPPERTYIAVYDFDSRPDEDTFARVALAATQGSWPDVIQQVPLVMKNVRSMSGSWANALVVLHGLQHNVRSVGLELSRLVLLAASIRVPAYCMGAGMFILLRTLENHDYFPTAVDDIPLGFRYSLYGARFAPIPSYNLVDLPPTLRSIINQRALIFRGVLGFFEEIKRAYRRSPPKLHNVLPVLSEGITSSLELLVFPWLLLAFVLWRVWWGPFDLLSWGVTLLPYASSIAGLLVTLSVPGMAKRPPRWSTVGLAILASPLDRFIRSVGSWALVIRVAHAWLSGRRVTYGKTERVDESAIDL